MFNPDVEFLFCCYLNLIISYLSSWTMECQIVRPVPTAPLSEEDSGANSAEAYGFVGWISSAIAYVIYIVWAFVPEAYLHQVGVTYYPSKFWAVALPAHLCVTVIFVFWIYESLNMMSAHPPTSLSTIRDKHTRPPPPRRFDDCVPSIYDIPIHEVSKTLYRYSRVKKHSCMNTYY
mmetsp:Transcript_29876/g.41334  ORF Transcript_29876/g.41334 Transcript_29876/m.41334 type:complete len:176 (-) Transcript_29876:2-529(-)